MTRSYPASTHTRRASGDIAIGGTDCAHFVLNATSLQLIPAYSSQNTGFAQTLAGVGLSESE
jgi:hypothetical protein